MADRERTDKTLPIFVILAFVFLVGLGFSIFPRHEATATPTSAPVGASQTK